MAFQNRRTFFRRLGAVAAAAAASPARLYGSANDRPLRSPLQPLPSHQAADEAFWQLVKEQFPLRSGLTIMNAANLCPSPYPVIDAVTGLTRDVDSDASFQNRAKFAELRERARGLLAAYLGADREEIAITRNTSEGNNAVINGLELGTGDQVVIWDQNHPTNNIAWDVRAKRYGYSVRRVSTPVDEDLVEPFLSAMTGNTRVLAFSHVSNISGIGVPAKQLCTLARERGIMTLVDGAQTFGVLQVDLHDMGCDFYTGSSHKWLLGPKEAGILYVRSEMIDSLWPSDVGVGWAGALENGAQKFENLGQRDDAAVAAMGTAVTFHHTIGPDRVEQRVRSLAASIKAGLRDRVPRVRFHTPMPAEQSAGVVVFTVPGTDPRDLFSRMYAEHDVAGAAMGGAFAGVRLSPHVYNTMEDVNRVLEVVASMG